MQYFYLQNLNPSFANGQDSSENGNKCPAIENKRSVETTINYRCKHTGFCYREATRAFAFAEYLLRLPSAINTIAIESAHSMQSPK